MTAIKIRGEIPAERTELKTAVAANNSRETVTARKKYSELNELSLAGTKHSTKLSDTAGKSIAYEDGGISPMIGRRNKGSQAIGDHPYLSLKDESESLRGRSMFVKMTNNSVGLGGAESEHV